MKTPLMKLPAYLSLHHVLASTNTSLQKIKKPLYLSLRDAVTVTNTSFRKITTPIHLSMSGVIAVTTTSFRKMKTPFYLTLLGVAAVANTSFKKKVLVNTASVTRYTYSVVIIKSKYELKIFDSTGEWIVTYPVVFGNKDMRDKMMEGDRRTPEGIFHIANKRKHAKWNSFMMIDYPTQESYQKFNQRKAQGIIPSGAKIGGAIGIHGTWPREDFAIDQYQNWTEGCISTKNHYVEEIFALLPVGTRVEIRH